MNPGKECANYKWEQITDYKWLDYYTESSVENICTSDLCSHIFIITDLIQHNCCAKSAKSRIKYSLEAASLRRGENFKK